MPNPRTPTEGEDLRALLERELEERRGQAPKPGEIFVLSETAELPVEWALLEARPNSFLAIPADTQPLAGSRDFALSKDVLSGPLVLRCGHAAEIAASRLRPELRTGLLDPRSLAAARSLQAALAAGVAAEDPVGEEVDRDPEYRDWVEEVLDPARAVMVGLGEEEAPRSAEVIPFEGRRSRRALGRPSNWSRILPWLAAASLAIALGLSRWEFRQLEEAFWAPQFDEVSVPVRSETVRGEVDVTVAPPTGSPVEKIHFSGSFPVEPKSFPMAVVLLDKHENVLAHSPFKIRSPEETWSMTIRRSRVPAGPYRIELRSPEEKTVDFWTINIAEAAAP